MADCKMAPTFSAVNEIGPSRTQWALKLRLVRTYIVPAFTNPRIQQSMECVFHDSQGTRLHATVKKEYIPKFADVLIEGHLFAVKNFVVLNNRMRFKTTTNKYVIMFLHDTKVVEIFDEGFPSMMFDCRSFSNVAVVGDLNEFELFDIIGRVLSVNRPQSRMRDNREMRWMEMTLEDPKGEQLQCTIWNEYVDQMMDCVRNGGEEAPIIMLLFCRGKIYQDKVTISTAYNVTKMIINGDLEYVADYRKRFVSENNASAVNNFSLSSICLANGESSHISDSERTIQQIRYGGQVGCFWVHATIISIESGRKWWYVSCSKCHRKTDKVENNFYCSSCDYFESSGTLRYKIEVMVQDTTNNARLLLWDPQCVELLGKTASDLRDNSDLMTVNGDIPELFNVLLGMEMMFKVQVRPDQLVDFEGAYTVKNITRNGVPICQSMPSYACSQGSDQHSKSEMVFSGNEENLKLDDGTSTPIKTQSSVSKGKKVLETSSVKRKLIEDFCAVDEEEMKKVHIKIEKE